MFTFGPLTVVEPRTLRPVVGRPANVRDAAGDPVQTYDTSGNPRPVVTGSRGQIGQFQADSPVVHLDVPGGDPLVLAGIELLGQVGELHQLTTTGRLSEASLKSTIATEIDRSVEDVIADVMEPVIAPGAFNWADNPLTGKIRRKLGGGFYAPTFDITTRKVQGGATYWVDINNGSASNPGTEAAPLAALSSAIEKPDVGTIMVRGVAAGSTPWRPYYPRTYSFGPGGWITKSINIIGVGDAPPILSAADVVTWTPTAGRAGVHQVNLSAVEKVVDTLPDPHGLPYYRAATVDEVEATPGSYHVAGSTVYVRTIDGRAPDAHLAPIRTSAVLAVSGDHTLYVENLTILGGTSCIAATKPSATEGNGLRPAVYGNKVALLHAATNGLSIKGGDAIMVGSLARHNTRDGFNYHTAAGVAPRAVEIDCEGSDNGDGTGNSDNGSTIHGGGKAIRVGGLYARNDGGNITDVNDGTRSWNLGVTATDSRKEWDFYATTGDARMWLDRCAASGSQWSAAATDGATIYARDSALATRTGNVIDY